jgi:hypothetical protein
LLSTSLLMVASASCSPMVISFPVQKKIVPQDGDFACLT